jgi:hypothetical protein
MPKCHIPSCLGHANERSVRVTCVRCQGERYTLVPSTHTEPEPYTCLRCREALRGGHVVDPLASVAQAEARARSFPRREGPETP